MKYPRSLGILFLIGPAVLAVHADETRNLTPPGVDISMTGTPQQWSTLTFRLLNDLPAGKQATLVLDARIDGTSNTGAAACLTVQVNGHTLTGPAYYPTVIPSDLINKADEFLTLWGWDFAWYSSGCWSLLYSPDYAVPMPMGRYQLTDPNQAPYHFVWDITPYLNPSHTAVNPVILTATLNGSTVHLKNVQIRVADPLAPGPGILPSPPPTGAVPAYVAASPGTINMNVQLYPGGSLTLNVNGNAFTANTRTSEPFSINGNGWRLTGTTGTPSWILTGGYGTASWNGTNNRYHVSRRVDVLTDHIHIADNISNTGNWLVGMMYQNRLVLPANLNPTLSVKLAGRPSCNTWADSSDWTMNPTSIACWTDNSTGNPTLAIGLVAEDDIFRTHNMSFVEYLNQPPYAIGLWDQCLGIDVGAFHTLEWDIYPVPNGDYWAVINAIRRNWGSNYTIPGPVSCGFGLESGSQDASYYQQWMNQRGVKWLISTQGTAKTPSEWTQCGGPANNPGAFAESTSLPYAATWCTGVSNWATKVHNTVPGGKVLCYLDTQICTENGSFNNPTAVYADSQVFDYAGNRAYTPGTNVSGHPPIYVFLTTQNNSFGAAMNTTISTLFNTYAFDGIYYDEFGFAGNSFCSYDNYPGWEWDNCTVNFSQSTYDVIDTALTPGGRLTRSSLVQQPWKISTIQNLLNNGKVVYGNCGYTLTRSMTNLHIPLDVELGAFSSVLETHLCSPLGLGNHSRYQIDGDVARSRLVRWLLDFGGLLVPYYWNDSPLSQPHYISLMFPITPTELHPGVVMGTDRIITHKSGDFGWPDGAPARAYIFDGRGQYVSNLTGYDNASVRTIDNGTGGWLTEVRLASDHFAVLLKDPSVIMNVNGTVTLEDFSGDSSQVPLTIEVRPLGSTAPVETHPLHLDSAGHYSFVTPLTGRYDLVAAAPHWLRQKQSGVMISGTITVNFALLNGDCNGDNEISGTDLSILLAAMDAMPDDPHWDPSADLDGDNEITRTDLSIVLANMDRMGD